MTKKDTAIGCDHDKVDALREGLSRFSAYPNASVPAYPNVADDGHETDGWYEHDPKVMELCGWDPVSNVGKTFRCGWIRWFDLINYFCHRRYFDKVPDLAAQDGDELDADEALELSRLLQADLDSGNVAAYAEGRQSVLNMLRSIFKWDAQGRLRLGKRHLTEEEQRSEFFWFVENAQRFAAFLRDCGGFEIVEIERDR